MSSLGLKRAVSNAVYQNLRDEIPDLQSQIDSNKSDITNLQNQISQLGTTDYYKTLIFRQHYTQSSKFPSKESCQRFNDTIDNPESSLQFSIIGDTDLIKGDFNTYVYMINIVSYGAVTKEHTHTVDTAIDNKNVCVISQGYNRLWSDYDNEGADATIVHSSGMFRSSVLTGGG